MAFWDYLTGSRGRLSISSIITGLIGLAYISGYIISALFLRHRGISPLPLLKAQYIETGLAFLIVTSILAGIPFLILHMAKSDIGSNKYLKYMRISLAALVTVNYLVVVAIIVIFIEREWSSNASILRYNMRFYNLLISYLAIIILLLIAPRMILRRKKHSDKTHATHIISTGSFRNRNKSTNSLLFWNLITIFLYSFAFIITVMTDYEILESVHWLRCFISHISMYLIASLFLVLAISVVWYFAKGSTDSGIRMKTWLIGLPAFLLCYYFCIMAYSYRVFPNVPSSRGGKYPTSEVSIHFKSTYEGIYSMPDLFYVIEETDKFLYAVAVYGCEWYHNDDKVYAIPISEISWIEMRRMIHDEPRNRLCMLSESES